MQVGIAHLPCLLTPELNAVTSTVPSALQLPSHRRDTPLSRAEQSSQYEVMSARNALIRPGFVPTDKPIHPEPGVYILESATLNETGRTVLNIKSHLHILKIGTTGDFDTRRATVNGRLVDRSYAVQPYFDVNDWYLVRFRAFDEAGQAGEHEHLVHRALDEHRLTIEQADTLCRANGGRGWAKRTQPELFVMGLANTKLLRLIPSDPSRTKRPRDHSAYYRRRLCNMF